ncbi:MAG TPA: T9SS type A sorting domain-containing protein [Puia sp.]|nr:T9SS type A sorting domain-containing protein [Puia sp.]
MKTVPAFLKELFCPKGPFAVLLLACLCLYAPDAGAQINAYAKVTAVSGTTLSLSNTNQTYHTFAAGEQIIVMQMQDNVIGSNTSNTSTFGTVSAIANAGKYEVATISSVTGMPTSMKLTAALTNTYTISTSGNVQIISFNTLSTTNYTTTANIAAVSWNGSVGGVVAFQVGGTLTLSNSVTVDGQGFRGGAVSADYEVSCEPSVYDATSSNYAYKGEGIYSSSTISYTSHTSRGPLLNGGGGGSDDNGGGGGGGNYTAGGTGGPGYTCTTTNASGGIGGVALGTYVTYNRIFMGGGGGGGQQNNGLGTAGGNGGGIIMIKANTLKTSCTGTVLISASGTSAATSGNDGAGGAGAAGSIVLQVNTFTVPSTCPLTVQANGGSGGNVGDANAHGGGGGQGAVMYSASLPSTNVTTNANNGAGGLNSSSSGAASAGSGAGTNNAGILTGLPTILPINFLSFTAEKNGNESILYWSTGETYQQQLFTIQRSYDGVNFNTIGVVDGAPGTTATEEYQYTDASPASDKNYYRIQVTDLAGRQTYSAIVLIDRSGSQNTFGIYPNPAGRAFTIRLGEPGSPVISVAISDLTGKTVWSQSCHTSGNLIPVTLSGILVPGIYFVRLTDNGQTQMGKLLIR